MAIQITKSEERIEPVTLLSKIKMKWLSLVDRASNAAPFQVTKEDTMAAKYIQAIILPDGTMLEDLSKLYDKDFRASSVEKHDGCTKCILAPVEAFKEVEAIKADLSPGAQFLVGEPVETAQKADMVAAPTVMDAPVAQETLVMQRTFRDELGRKAEALMSAIFAAAELQTDPGVRKKQAVGAAKAFTDWLGSALDATATATKTDIDLDALKKITDKVKPPSEAIKTDNPQQEADEMDEKQIQELVATQVTEALKADREAADNQARLAKETAEKEALKADLAAMKAELETLKTAATKAETKPEEKMPSETDALKADIQKIVEAVQNVGERVAGLENAVPGSASPSGDGATKSDDPNAVFYDM